ncbi:MAG: L-rhamnose mutarotase [Acutalibacteraceae bacterium]|nr:L-rhamnose mutarotase [Acutalibacteraceae bacterium]
MKRIGTVTKVKEGMMDAYIKIHDEIWDDVVEASHSCGTRNFTIFAIGDYLFSYSEYVGDDFEADMKRKAELPAIKKWKEATGAMLTPVNEEQASIMLKEIFHHDF